MRKGERGKERETRDFRRNTREEESQRTETRNFSSRDSDYQRADRLFLPILLEKISKEKREKWEGDRERKWEISVCDNVSAEGKIKRHGCLNPSLISRGTRVLKTYREAADFFFSENVVIRYSKLLASKCDASLTDETE